VFNDKIVYPLPWFCDEAKFYVANFTEASAKIKVKESHHNTQGAYFDNSTPYYILIWDDNCDGNFKPTNAMVDDDPIFGQGQIKSGQDYIPYDFNVPENISSGAFNWGEHWMRIGDRSWPFTITQFDGSDATLFSFKDWTIPGKNLTLWVQSMYFDGLPVNGNVSIKKIEGFTYGCGGTKREVINISGTTQIVNGTGYLELDLAQLSGGDYSAKFKLFEDSLGSTEKIDVNFWIEDKMKEPMGCSGGDKGGGGIDIKELEGEEE
jgi:hypothetical protein